MSDSETGDQLMLADSEDLSSNIEKRQLPASCRNEAGCGTYIILDGV